MQNEYRVRKSYLDGTDLAQYAPLVVCFTAESIHQGQQALPGSIGSSGLCDSEVVMALKVDSPAQALEILEQPRFHKLERSCIDTGLPFSVSITIQV